MTTKTDAALAVALEHLEKLVDEHDKILVRGNGEPSLQEVVRNIDKNVTEIMTARETERAAAKAAEKAKQESKTWWVRAFASPIIQWAVGGLTMFIAEAFYYYTQIKPLLDKIQMEELLKK